MANYILGTLAGVSGGEGIRGELIGLSGSLVANSGHPVLVGVLAGLGGALAGGQKYAAIDAELSGLGGDLTAYSDRIGRLTGELAGIDGSLVTLNGVTAQLVAPLVGLSGGLVATPHKIVALSGSLAGLSGGIVAHVLASGSLVGALVGITGRIDSYLSGPFYIVSMNPALRGVTEYTNFGFNSFFELGGNYYGLNDSGIYLLSGSDDDGVPVSAYFESGDVEYAKGQQSKVLDAHILGRTDAAIDFTLYEDDGAGNTYASIGDTSGAVQQHRFKPGRGAQGRRWRYRVSNVSGGTLEAQELSLLIAELSRKR